MCGSQKLGQSDCEGQRIRLGTVLNLIYKSGYFNILHIVEFVYFKQFVISTCILKI